MPQARGSQTRIVLFEESTYGEAPGAPAGIILPVTSFALASSQGRLDSATIAGSRARTRPALGNIDAAGAIGVEVAAESIGLLLKHALGSVTTGRPVEAPTNVTGVSVVRASSATTPGDGTLSYTAVGTTLDWAAPGDTAGSGVDVSAGGSFTLTSNNGTDTLAVTVTAGSLPGGDQSDTLTVYSAYQHSIAIAESLPTGLHVEKNHGANIAGSGRYERFAGVRVNGATFTFPQEGYVTAEFDMKGAGSSLAAAALDATPTDNGHTSFSGFSIAAINEGGSPLAVVTQASIALANELDDSVYVIGGAGTRAALPEGFATVTGTLTALFDGPALLEKAINDTASSLDVTLQRGTGDGTDGNEYIQFSVPHLVYERASPPIEGPAGLLVEMNYKAYKDSSMPLSITLRNQQATL